MTDNEVGELWAYFYGKHGFARTSRKADADSIHSLLARVFNDWRLSGMTRQQVKDELWKLDEAVTSLTAQITQATGQSWKAAVESTYGNYRVHLSMARQLSLRLQDILQEAENELHIY